LHRVWAMFTSFAKPAFVFTGLLATVASCAQTQSPASTQAESGDAAVTPPVGSQLVESGTLTLRGVTSDGWAVYTDDDTLVLHAVPIAGGAARDIVQLDDSFALSIWSDVVFVWPTKNDAGMGPLTVWTAQSGPHAVSQASLAPFVAASANGDTVIYLDGVDPSGQTGNVVTAANDGSGMDVLLTSVQQLQSSACQALMGFAGAYAIVAHCDSGTQGTTISSFALSGSTRADLATNAVDYWSTDPNGTMVVTGTDAGSVVVPIGGGTPAIIDPSGTGGSVIGNGQAVVYGTKSGALRRSPVSDPAPMTLVQSGFGGLYALSPDENWLLYYTSLNSQQYVSDLYLASASAPGSPTTLSSSETARVFGDAYTLDSSHAMYFTDIEPSLNVGTLHAMALDGSGQQLVLGQLAWLSMAGQGDRVVFNDGFTLNGGRGRADIRVVDFSKGNAASLIVSQADSEIEMSPARDAVVYTWSLDGGARAGLYVAAIP
jgi:hypothetical protein